MCPVLGGYDNDSHGIWALAVDAKGATKSSVPWVSGKIDESDCSGTPITLRSDQEEAIMALKRHVAIYRKAEAVMLESPVRDSKANGAAERAVRSWAGQLRTIRHHVERKIKTTIPKNPALMSWLVSWAADVIFRYKVHSTCRSSHEWIAMSGSAIWASFAQSVLSSHCCAGHPSTLGTVFWKYASRLAAVGRPSGRTCGQPPVGTDFLPGHQGKGLAAHGCRRRMAGHSVLESPRWTLASPFQGARPRLSRHQGRA